jgi:hypothetical protein
VFTNYIYFILKLYFEITIASHLVTPFQCDLCVSRNLQGRNPGAHDELLMECIRQANLDALWGREASTVNSTLGGS